MAVTRQSLIIGAAIAVVHQIELGHITAHRAAGYYKYDDQVWKNFEDFQNALALGETPDQDRYPPYVMDALAHLRQSMRVDYDEWFAVFPWLEQVNTPSPTRR